MGNCFKSDQDVPNDAKQGNKSSDPQSQPQPKSRTARTNIPDPTYPSNQIKSTSTNILTFIPLNLIYQFKNEANLYFILIAIFQVIPAVSLTDGKPTILIPLTFVITTVLLKDAYQQINRYLKDRQENQRSIQILTNQGFKTDQWWNVKVGTVIKIKNGQLIPCDAVVLKTSLPDNKCFIQTKSLDGQTNLKQRFGPKSRFNLQNLSPLQLFRKNYLLEFQPPNLFLNKFLGSIQIQSQVVPLNIENLILRGCYLRNVSQALCVCVFSGPQTKVILNSAKFYFKQSKLRSKIGGMIISIFIWQVVIALVLALFNMLFQVSYNSLMDYFHKSKFWILGSSWWLIMTYFVPISLMVTMEMVKLFQGVILGRDPRGWVEQFQCNASANNTSVNENLGQIRYVFTDKTGTLTKNEMKFRKIITGGQIYGNQKTIQQAQLQRYYPKVNNVKFYDSNFLKNSHLHQDTLKVIYLCHDISINKDDDGKQSYTSASPDQIALINFAKLCGKQYLGLQGIDLKIFDRKSNHVIKFKKLAFLQFNSDRKRMSIIVRNQNNQVQILTKGADSSVFRLLAPNQRYRKQTQDAINQFSVQGLRTLLLAKRRIPQDQYVRWKQNYDRASVSIQNRKQKLQQCYNLIQRNLNLVAATAVQDQLQDFVQETIQTMKNAGIRFYILTGDKKQTAISIGKSCGLIQPDATIFDIPDFVWFKQNGPEKDKFQRQWKDYLRKAKEFKGEKVYLLNAQIPLPPQIPLHQTICYRCTPVQKSNIVKFVKDKTPDLTLAIGDGANDVNMITMADVGIGVRGKQGTQATRVSDFVIGQYSLLSFLTLYYGRQWYKRNCRLVAYNFYKNWYHVSAVIGYGAYTYFSAALIFDIYMYELFNLFFAAVPIIVYAVFDQQHTLKQSLKFSQLYQPGLSDRQFNQTVYYKSIGRGVAYGLISLVVVFMTLQDNVLDSQGRMGYLAQSGAVLYSNIVANVNLRILVLSTGITPFMLFSVYGSIIFYWFVYILYTKSVQTDLSNSFSQQLTTIPILLIQVILISILTLGQFAYEKYIEFDEKIQRLKYIEAAKEAQDVAKKLVSRLLMGQSFGNWKLASRDSGGNFMGSLLGLPQPQPKNNKRMMKQQR